MATYVLTRAAVQDVHDIADYSEAQWGRERAAEYLAHLAAAFTALTDDAWIFQPIEDVRPGYYRARAGRHVIFFRRRADTIEIVRILHESRDLPNAF